MNTSTLLPHSGHVDRRVFLKGTLATATGALLPNWASLFGSQTVAADMGKRPRRCILLWMNGGPSQFETFDMKPGRPTGGPFRPIASNVTGIQVSEYLPRIARQADKLAIIRSMKTLDGNHPAASHILHVGRREPDRSIRHPEIGAMVAKYLGPADSDLPSYVLTGAGGGYGPGFLGPTYQPFRVGQDGKLPEFTQSYLSAPVEARRNDLLRFVEGKFAREHQAEPYETHRAAKEKSWRLLKSRSLFDISKEWPRYRERYGDSDFGRACLLARKLVESGVPFVEVGQREYDTHGDNFTWHKANLQILDPAWAALLEDLHERGLLDDTLVVWMGEFGRSANVNNKAGRDHQVNGWSVVLAGAGIKGGQIHGATDIDGRDVKDAPVTEGDLFATIYTALGINPRTKHYVGTRPVWATTEGAQPIQSLLGGKG
ncbi:MAG: DUF1501 domain-containing protein [Gemmataceae bacterium]